MKLSVNILNYSKYALAVFVLLLTIGFTNKKQSDRYVKDVVINIDNQFENYFIDQSDVFDLVHETGKTYLLNLDLSQLDLRVVEKKIEAHRFIDDAEVFHDLNGVLTIEIKQNRPLARILNPNGKDKYIGTTGLILPESTHYTARVPLISISNKIFYSNENVIETEEGKKLFELLTFIENDPFWKAQIAGMDIDSKYELTLHPQVTKQEILFGTADDYQDKLRRLKVFYKEILPSKGWNNYSVVNLKYKKQIVCK